MWRRAQAVGRGKFGHPGSGGLIEYPASAAQACHLVVRPARACVLPVDHRGQTLQPQKSPLGLGPDLMVEEKN